MLPHERSLVKELADDFAIVGVNSDPKKTLVSLVENGTTTWRNFTDQQDGWKISDKWGVRGWPTIYVLDQQGVIRFKGLRGKQLEAAVRGLIKEGKEKEADPKIKPPVKKLEN